MHKKCFNIATLGARETGERFSQRSRCSVKIRPPSDTRGLDARRPLYGGGLRGVENQSTCKGRLAPKSARRFFEANLKRRSREILFTGQPLISQRSL